MRRRCRRRARRAFARRGRAGRLPVNRAAIRVRRNLMSMSWAAGSALVRYQGCSARRSSMPAGSQPCRAYQMTIRVCAGIGNVMGGFSFPGCRGWHQLLGCAANAEGSANLGVRSDRWSGRLVLEQKNERAGAGGAVTRGLGRAPAVMVTSRPGRRGSPHGGEFAGGQFHQPGDIPCQSEHAM